MGDEEAYCREYPAFGSTKQVEVVILSLRIGGASVYIFWVLAPLNSPSRATYSPEPAYAGHDCYVYTPGSSRHDDACYRPTQHEMHCNSKLYCPELRKIVGQS